MNSAASDLKSIFGDAIEIQSSTDRAAYLADACGSDRNIYENTKSNTWARKLVDRSEKQWVGCRIPFKISPLGN